MIKINLNLKFNVMFITIAIKKKDFKVKNFTIKLFMDNFIIIITIKINYYFINQPIICNLFMVNQNLIIYFK